MNYDGPSASFLSAKGVNFSSEYILLLQKHFKIVFLCIIVLIKIDR